MLNRCQIYKRYKINYLNQSIRVQHGGSYHNNENYIVSVYYFNQKSPSIESFSSNDINYNDSIVKPFMNDWKYRLPFIDFPTDYVLITLSYIEPSIDEMIKLHKFKVMPANTLYSVLRIPNQEPVITWALEEIKNIITDHQQEIQALNNKQQKETEIVKNHQQEIQALNNKHNSELSIIKLLLKSKSDKHNELTLLEKRIGELRGES
jgi:hypothetical protein